MKLRQDCPGCGGKRLGPALCLPRQPVVLNYRFPTAAAARRVPRRDVTLVQCRDCGLAFNASFDDSVIPYDAGYENRQCFSPAFVGHLNALAARLARRIPAAGSSVLEVGCGKGDFLRMICAQSGASGVGYDTSYEGPPIEGALTFHHQYVGAGDIDRPFDLILCRHVVEHVGEIGAFFRELASIARAAGDPLVVVETPRFEWIVEGRCLWDVFYEHCNYFPMATLAHLGRLAGFRVVRHSRVFGAQYQLLELKLARTSRRPLPARLGPEARLAPFAKAARRRLDTVERRIADQSGGGRWAIWGAGAKGVALVNQLQSVHPDCVIDSNAAKQGCVIPGSRVPVVAPADPRVSRLKLILIANPNYAGEISATLKSLGFAGRLLVLQ
jgi:SAM-dependent methyltransferase